MKQHDGSTVELKGGDIKLTGKKGDDKVEFHGINDYAGTYTMHAAYSGDDTFQTSTASADMSSR